MHLWQAAPPHFDPGLHTVEAGKTGLDLKDQLDKKQQEPVPSRCPGRKRVVLVHVGGASRATAEPSAGSVSWAGGGGAGLGGSRLGQEAWTQKSCVKADVSHLKHLDDNRGLKDVCRPCRKAEVWVTGIEPSLGMDNSSSVVMESLSRLP